MRTLPPLDSEAVIRSLNIARQKDAGAFLPLALSAAGVGAPGATAQSPASRTPATYYVDSVNGNDSNRGTSPASAWKTLEKINAMSFIPDDHILLKSGSVWEGQLWPKGSGADGHPITLDRYGGGVKPAIHGAGLAEDAVLLKNQEYWEIQGLEITNTGPAPAVRRGVHVAVENFGDAHHVFLRALSIHDVNG
jgi:hypothetical protein